MQKDRVKSFLPSLLNPLPSFFPSCLSLTPFQWLLCRLGENYYVAYFLLTYLGWESSRAEGFSIANTQQGVRIILLNLEGFSLRSLHTDVCLLSSSP